MSKKYVVSHSCEIKSVLFRMYGIRGKKNTFMYVRSNPYVKVFILIFIFILKNAHT